MAVSLAKGQRISLSKNDGSALKTVMFGAGWDVAKKGGFLGGLFGGGGGGSIDLDLSAILFDASKNVVDQVYFGQLRSRDGSIAHSGDNLTGEGDGDDEVIKVDLSSVPANIESIVFTISSFRGQTFANVENAFCRVVDTQTGSELARYDLSAKGDYTALVISKFYRHNSEWKMVASGEPTNGKHLQEMIPFIKQVIL